MSNPWIVLVLGFAMSVVGALVRRLFVDELVAFMREDIPRVFIRIASLFFPKPERDSRLLEWQESLDDTLEDVKISARPVSTCVRSWRFSLGVLVRAPWVSRSVASVDDRVLSPLHGVVAQTAILVIAAGYFWLIDSFVAPLPFSARAACVLWVFLAGIGVISSLAVRPRRGSLFDPPGPGMRDRLQRAPLRRRSFFYMLRIMAPSCTTIVGLVWIVISPSGVKVGLVVVAYILIGGLVRRKSARDPEMDLVASVFASERLRIRREAHAVRYERMLRPDSLVVDDVSGREVVLGWLIYVGIAAGAVLVTGGLIRTVSLPVAVWHFAAAVVLAGCTSIIGLVAVVFVRLALNRINTFASLLCMALYFSAAVTWVLTSAQVFLARANGIAPFVVYCLALGIIVFQVTWVNIAAAKNARMRLYTPMAAMWVRGYQQSRH